MGHDLAERRGGTDGPGAAVAPEPRRRHSARRERRDEIQAARARIRAGEARPTIVSALEDPMISPSLDHLPFMLGGADVSFTIEQQIPLSGIRGHRRASALADVDRLRAEASRAPWTSASGRQRLPHAAGAPTDRGARRRAARLRARRRQRRERPIRQRNRAAVGRACAPRSRWRGSRRLPARSSARCAAPKPCSTRASRWTPTAPCRRSRPSRSRSRLLPGRRSRRR